MDEETLAHTDDPEAERRAEFRRDVDAARAGDADGARRACLWAGQRAGHDAEWDAMIADASDVVGSAPPPLPGYEAAAVRSAARAPSGRAALAGFAVLAAALLFAVIAATMWG